MKILLAPPLLWYPEGILEKKVEKIENAFISNYKYYIPKPLILFKIK
jgi:hypothetical protein